MAAERLDNSTDAAAAIAVTLHVMSSGGVDSPSTAALLASLADLSAFATGFGIVGTFWHAHVRWRHFRGPGGAASVALTFALVFLMPIYVFHLAALARSLDRLAALARSLDRAAFGGGSGFAGSLGDLSPSIARSSSRRR